MTCHTFRPSLALMFSFVRSFFLRATSAWAVLGVVGSLTLHADEPTGYYAAAYGKTGAVLKAALHTRIQGHRSVGYDGVWNALHVLDADPANTNNVLCLYSRISRSRTQHTGSGGVTNGWNREHVWAQSYGIDGVDPAYSDLFHLRAEDETVNGTRGNLPFDESTTNTTGYAKPADPESPLASKDDNSWEPPDLVKGDVARAMFYMDVRYEGGGEPNLALTDDLATVTTSAARLGKLSTLLVWHLLDPVSPEERLRNDRIYTSYQSNRNPFIDRPEWVVSVFGAALDMKVTATNQSLLLTWPSSWPTNLTLLERTSNFTAWSAVTNVPVSTNGQWRVLVPRQGPQLFYRLRLHYAPG